MIKAYLKLVLLFLLSAPVCFGQNVTVSGQAVDSDGQQWIGGSYQISLSLPAGSTGYYDVNTGFPFLASYGGSLDGTGSFSVALLPTTLIRPLGSEWKFVICPNVLGAACGIITTPITASGSISSQINSTILAPRVTGGPGIYAYSDIEVSAFPNNSYFNVISQENRCYSTSWSPCNSGGGAGVASLNSLTGAVEISQGTNIVVSTSGNMISVSCPLCGLVQSLTTNGSSGPATLIAGVLNIPQYAGGGGGGGTFASITSGTNTSASMLVGTGASLGPEGSGVVTANSYSGATTGSGAVVLAGSPTITGANLGTPTAITLTNGTGLPWTGLTGTPSTTQVPFQSLTTTGTNGPATLISGVLNVPQYAGAAFQVNGTGLISSTTINFESSAATNGLTVTFTNPTSGNVQLGLSGTLNNAGLTNSSTTVNSQVCTLGGSCTIPIQTNGSGNALQAGINLSTSTTNSVGLTVTPVNSSTNVEKFEITGGSYTGNAATASNLLSCTGSAAGDLCIYNGSAWTRLAGNASGTSFLQETSAGVPSWAGGTSSVAWSSISNPTTTLALSMGNSDTTTWTVGAATGANNMFTWTDTATNSSATGILGHFTTTASSTLLPWKADANGVGWEVNASGQLVSTGTGNSTIAMSGSSSGTITQTVPNAAGTATVTWGNGTGTPAVTASAPLAISTTTGNITINGAAGEVLAGAGPTFTATPTLGASGTLGSLTFGNATSGLLTLETATGAITSYTIQFPVVQPTSGNTYLSCTAASPAVCTWSAAASLSGLTTNVLLKAASATTAENSSVTDNATTVTTTDTGGYVAPVFVANGTTAGFIDFPEGSTSASVAPCNTATSICVQAPTTVTSYVLVLPGAQPTSSNTYLSCTAANPSVCTWTSAASGTIPISSGGTNATSAAAGTIPNATSGTASSWTATPTLGAAGTLGSLTFGNATSGLLTIEPATGAITSYTIQLPVAQPSGSNTYLSCTAANPAVCTWAAGGSGGSSALSAITAATGANTIANGNHGAQVWNWAQTTNSQTAFTFGETTAATGTSDLELLVQTSAGSTAVPLTVQNSLTGSQTLAALQITPTWNTTGVVDAALLVNPTNTASGTGSLLADFQLGGTSKWKVDKAGNVTEVGTNTALDFVSNGTTAGFMDFPEGSTSASTSPCNTATSICIQAPTTVTSYLVDLPPAAANGIVTNTNTSSVVTQGFSGDSGHSATVTISSGTSVGSTSLCSTTICPAGTYMVNAYIDVTTACTTTGSYYVSLIYTDDEASKTIVMPLQGTGTTTTYGPSAMTSSLALSSTSNFAQGQLLLRSTGAASINYSTTAGACGTGGPAAGKMYLSVVPVQ